MTDKTMGPVEKELTDRLFYLADPKTKWVKGYPDRTTENQACLMIGGPLVSNKAWSLVGELTPADDPQGTTNFAIWNDAPDRTRQHVIWLLSDAVDEAHELGI